MTESPSRAPAWGGGVRPTLLLYGSAAALIIALHLATDGVLGFHIDELYYLASGRHPAFGYVDFPPVVPLLALCSLKAPLPQLWRGLREFS